MARRFRASRVNRFAAKTQAVLQGVAFRGGASFKVEKAHFAARQKGLESRKNEVKLRPPLCQPLKHSTKNHIFTMFERFA